MAEAKLSNRVLRKERVVRDPAIARFLTTNPLASLIWLPLRLWLGWQWLDAGLHKVNNEAWVNGGQALRGFWTGAVAVPAEAGARPAIAFDWYRNFIQMMLDNEAYTWFGPLVAYGETLIGIALIVGAFTGIAAFFAGFMNWNFIMAGAASTNGLLFAIAVGLILAWKVSGYIGLDYFLLPLIGTPWGRERREAREALGRTAEEPVSAGN